MSPGGTALRSARAEALLALDPARGRVLPPEMAAQTRDLLEALGLLPGWVQWLHQVGPARRGLDGLRDLGLPGRKLDLAVRKRFFHDLLVAELEAGAEQVLSLGAGFDVLCPYLSRRYREVRFLEIDRDEVVAAKSKALATLGRGAPNLGLFGGDLALPVLARMISEFVARDLWSWDRRSVVLAENVLMFLPATSVRAHLEALHSSTGDESLLVLSSIHKNRKGVVGGGRLDAVRRAALRLTGEPLRWGKRADALGTYLGNLGWVIEQMPDVERRRRDYLEPQGLGEYPLAGVEDLVAARRGTPVTTAPPLVPP